MAWLCLPRLRFKREKRKSEKKFLHGSWCKIRRTYIASTATYSKTDEYIRTIIIFYQRRACPFRFSLLKTTTIHKKFSKTRWETTIQGAEAQGAVEHGEVHRDLNELPPRFMFRLHDLPLLVHNHLLLGPVHYKALPSHILYSPHNCPPAYQGRQ